MVISSPLPASNVYMPGPDPFNSVISVKTGVPLMKIVNEEPFHPSPYESYNSTENEHASDVILNRKNKLSNSPSFLTK